MQSEETKSSDKNGPYSIISTVVITIIVGYAYVVGVTFAVTDLDHVLDINNDAHGYAIAQVFYDAFLNRYGSGTGGIVCLAVVAVAIFFCGLSYITSNSRYAGFESCQVKRIY
jgi:amino acid transporter